MSSIFDNFSEEVKKILLASQRISEDLLMPTATEHLLLGLLIVPDTYASQILKEEMVNPERVRVVIKIHKRKVQNNSSRMHITNELIEILKMAADKMVARSDDKIRSLDLLWAIARYNDCSAGQILRSLGVDLDRIDKKIEELMSQRQNAPKPEKPLEILEAFGGIEEIMDSMKGVGFGIFPPGVIISAPHIQKQKGAPKKSKNPYLDEFGINLTMLAVNKKLDPVIGRNAEIERLVQILCRRTKNNPVLVGDPGVGKTAIIEGLAQKIVNNQIPARLIDKQIITLDLAAIVAGTMYRGQFENRLKQIISEAKNNPNIILFIDELHTIVGSGAAEGSMDTANILKPALSKGEVRLIGSTTFDEYRKFIEKDAALERRMQKIIVAEPTISEACEILKGIKENYEKFHQIKIDDAAIEAAVKLSNRYVSDRFLPDKAIDLIDEASSSVSLKMNPQAKNKQAEITTKLHEIIAKKEQAANTQDYSQAAYLKSRELQLKQELTLLQKKSGQNKAPEIVTQYDVAKIVASWTKIPLGNLILENVGKIKNLEKKLAAEIIGQDEALTAVTSAIKRSKTQLSDPKRPTGVFIFLGPTGVGKTKLAKVLAQTIFGSEKQLVKIDMSEFMERHNTARLVGSPPGYIGYEDAGKLTETIRRQPYSVVLLDEIEKAHPDVFNILLQIMEDGYLTDARGRCVNFRNCIIIMTSNIGMAELTSGAAQIGFTKSSQDKEKNNYQKIEEKVKERIKQNFAPEFLNRLDQMVIFKPLGIDSIQKIVSLELNTLKKRLSDQKIKLSISSKVIKFLAQKAYEPEYGARSVRRTITKYIEECISNKILQKPQLSEIKIELKKNRLALRTK